MSFDIILPFLRPIEKFILDDNVSEVMVNPSGRVFIEQNGHMTEVPEVVLENRLVEIAVRHIARLLGDDISEEQPILDSRLPDGSRVAALLPPCSIGGTTLTIRKFSGRWYTVDELVAMGSLSETFASRLIEAVSNRQNILISGGTGTGKTTVLNALASLIPDDERIVVIEDTAEIHLAKPNVVRWETRRAQIGVPAVTIRGLVKTSLRHRPDRLLIGEVRGEEAFDLLQALNTGHAGSLSTIHANSAVRAVTRLTNCVLESGVELPYAAIRANVISAFDLVVQLERIAGKRLVSELIEVEGYDFDTDSVKVSSADQHRPPKKSRTTRK